MTYRVACPFSLWVGELSDRRFSGGIVTHSRAMTSFGLAGFAVDFVLYFAITFRQLLGLIQAWERLVATRLRLSCERG